jgi:hypothetical protein
METDFEKTKNSSEEELKEEMQKLVLKKQEETLALKKLLESVANEEVKKADTKLSK